MLIEYDCLLRSQEETTHHMIFEHGPPPVKSVAFSSNGLFRFLSSSLSPSYSLNRSSTDRSSCLNAFTLPVPTCFFEKRDFPSLPPSSRTFCACCWPTPRPNNACRPSDTESHLEFKVHPRSVITQRSKVFSLNLIVTKKEIPFRFPNDKD